jgi:hypothetical protein
MTRIDDITSKGPELGLAAYSKQFYDSPSHQDYLKRQEKEVERQERTKEREIENKERAMEREIEHIEKLKETQSDRWFQAKLVISGAFIGVLLTELFHFIFH